MSLPLIRSVSAMLATSGTGGPITAWPAGHGVGWAAIILIQTSNEVVAAPGVPDPAHLVGCTESLGSPIGTGTAGAAGATRLTVYEKRATSGAEPDIRVFNTGNHICYVVIFVSDIFATGSVVVVGATPSVVAAPGSTAVSIPGLTTTTVDNLILAACAHGRDISTAQFDPLAWANASLANVVERVNDSTAAGNGGGLGIVSGEKAATGAVSATTGTLLTAVAQAKTCLAIRGGTAAAVPISDFCCGAECDAPVGVLPTSGDDRHWHSEGGTPAVSQTTLARNGRRAWLFAPVNDVSYRGRSVSATQRVFRGYLYFDALPSSDCELVRFLVASGGFSPELRFRKATNDIVGGVSTALTTAVPVVAGVWYRIEMLADVSANPRTLKLRTALADAASTDRGTASFATAANTITEVQRGASCGTSTTARVVWDDMREGGLASAYPFGAGTIVGLQPTGDGTHSYNDVGDFRDEQAIFFPVGTTLTWTRLVGLLSTAIQSYLLRAAAAVTEYVEWVTSGMPATTSISGVEVVTVHRQLDATTSQQTLKLIGGGGASADVFVAKDFSETVAVVNSKHFVQDPSAVAWTTALVNAFKARWPFSATGTPGIAGLIYEVDCVLSAAPPPPPGSPQQNPVHVYAAPGTYNVTLTVTDNNGLTDSQTHPVTVS
jgi:hypothetical protein